MISKKTLSISAILLIFIAGYIYKSQIRNRETTSAPLVNSPIITRPSPPSIPENFPRFVTGRPALVKKAQEIYKDRPRYESNNNEKFIGEKVSVETLGSGETLTLRSVNVSFANDLYACAEEVCDKKDAVITTNGYHVFKGSIPRKMNSKSKALVTFNKNNYQYGIWERRVIIELKNPIDFSLKLTNLHFESIERPQPKLFIAEYVGEISELDAVINEIKNVSEVSKVRLEITYSKDRTN